MAITQHGEPLVEDASTGLVWADTPSPGDLEDGGSDEGAFSSQVWVAGLNTFVNPDGTVGYGGYTDWYQPSASQLAYLFTNDLGIPAKTTSVSPFTHLDPNIRYYWSSTLGPQPGEAYLWDILGAIKFDILFANTGYPQGTMAVRGVQTAAGKACGQQTTGAGTSFSLTVIPPAGSGSFPTTPPIGLALNACGEVTGAISPYYANGAFTVAAHLFVYSNGVTTDIASDCNVAVGNAINRYDAVAGANCANTETPTPLIYASTALQTISLSAISASAIAGMGQGINSAGQVAGSVELPSGTTCPGNLYHPFLYDPVSGSQDLMPSIQAIQPIGGCSATATAINDAGQIVGVFSDNKSASHAFLYDRNNSPNAVDIGYLTFVSPPPFCTYSAKANAISSNGMITGYSQGNCAGPEAYLYSGGSHGTMQKVGDLGGSQSIGNGVNASGQVVGESAVNGSTQHGFLFSNGTIADLNSLISSADAGRYTLVNGVAINDSGQILATGFLNSNPSQTVTFLLTPPSPTLTATLRSMTLDGSGNYVATVVLSDSGGAPVNLTTLGAASLVVVQNGKSVTVPALNLPAVQNSLAPGASLALSLTFPSSAAPAGAPAVLRWSASYTSGNSSGTLRLALP